jgi:membrane protein YqaA with SNARE-associated domain
MVSGIISSIIHNSFFVKYGLIGLFFNGMFSSFIPIPTEVTTSALLLGGANTFDIFLVLNIGSIIGGYIAYYIGYNAKLLRRFRKIPEKKYEQKSVNLMNKYGWTIIIFFSPWMPVIGDVASIIAGTKQFDLKRYTVAMISGKTIKSFVIVYLSSLVIPLIAHLLPLT